MRVAVVGGGIAGLTAAWRLKGGGADVVVLEAADHVGGRMSTVRVGPFRIDEGVTLLIEAYARVKALAAEVGLADTWFAFGGGDGGILDAGEIERLGTNPTGVLVRHPGLSVRSRVAMVRFFLDAWRLRDDLDFFDLGRNAGALDDVDAVTGIARLVGQDVVDHLVDPFVRTFHFHGARRMSFHAFEALCATLVARDGFVPSGFRGSMQALPDALAARLDVRVACPVRRVAAEASGVVVEHAGGTERFDAVVVATTPAVARALLDAPSPAQADVLARARTSTTVMASFRVPREAAGDFEGIWIPYDESRILCGCANDACKGSVDGDDVVLVLGLHEEAAAALAALDDAAILGIVAREWGRLRPACDGRMTGLHVRRWPEALPVYGPGDARRLAAFWADGQGDGGVWLCGDWLGHPWVEGAVRCGERVAAAVLAGA